ncbi:MAG: hypothetical protein O7A06_03710 [Acidobacteria bacterium]|nr:hypothetical protein [Acidobacteriota bacterium]
MDRLSAPQHHLHMWEDQGSVIGSTTSETDWNAIDGNLILEGDDKAWLSWGSFWGGIKMRRIDQAAGRLACEDTTLYDIACFAVLARRKTMARSRADDGILRQAPRAPLAIRRKRRR